MDTVVGQGRDPARPLTRGRSCMRQGIFVWNHDLPKISADDGTEFSVRGQPLTLHQPRRPEESCTEHYNHNSLQKPKIPPNPSNAETTSGQKTSPQSTSDSDVKTQNPQPEEFDLRIEFLTSVISKFRLQKRRDCLHEVDWTADQGQGQPRCSHCGKFMRTSPCLPEVGDEPTQLKKERVDGTKISSRPSRLQGKLLFIRDDRDPPKTPKGNKRRRAKKTKQGNNNSSSLPPKNSARLRISSIISQAVENEVGETKDGQKAEGEAGPRRALVRFSSTRTVRTFRPDAPVSGPVRIETGGDS